MSTVTLPQTTLEVVLPYPHPLQREVLQSPARFKVVACGRRWGKTTMAMVAAVEAVIDGQYVWWVLPFYSMAAEIWRDLKQTLKAVTAHKSETERRIETVTGGVISVKSGDKPESLRGVGLDAVVIDEAAFVAEEVWTASLRPALSDREGRALLISTPRGRNWFYHAWRRGKDPEQSAWGGWQFPTGTSPTVDQAEIDDARGHLPENIFHQEYLAEFIEDAGLVFRNVRACVMAPPSAPQEGRRYTMGADWGKSNDFTALVVMDAATKQAVAIDRFNQIGWEVQRGRLAALARQWNVATILAEENSFGSPNIEALQSEGLPVEAFLTTGQSKQDIMVALQLAFERGEIGVPDDPVLIGELGAFEAVRLPSGKWRYAAPSGMHDDTVIALALALEASNRADVQVRFKWL